MTVKADVNSTLNGQSADLIIIEEGETRRYESKTLSGGTETLIFTELDGGRDKEYRAKIVPSTNNVTQTAEVNYGAEIEIDPIPHRDVDADVTIREQAEFNNGVSAKELGLGDHTLVGGLLTTALNDGEVLADDGYVYSTVQAAQDAASSWIFIGPATFNEAVTIDTAGLTVQGSGYNTFIDGGTDSAISATVTANVSNLKVQGEAYRTVDLKGGQNSVAHKIYAVPEGEQGISVGVDGIIDNCRVDGGSVTGIGFNGESRVICTNNTVENSNDGIIGGSDSIIANNVLLNQSNFGINTQSNSDGIIISNRVTDSTNDGVYVNSNASDWLIANNRMNNGINDNGSGTVLDANNIGASN